MPAPQQSQGGADNSLAPLWYIIGAFIVVGVIWVYFHTQIVAFIYQIRLWEAQLISLFDGHASNLVTSIKISNPADVKVEDIVVLSNSIGEYLRYPLAVILLVLAVAVYFGHINLRFKKIHDMQSLVVLEQESWPQITPVVSLDLVKTDIDQGPWAMALSPMQFAKKNNLLQEERILATSDSYSRTQAKVVATVRREEAYRVFSLQLGRYWTGIDSLSPHAKALFAVFAARAGRDRDGAAKLLLQIAASAQRGKLDFTGVDELIKKHRDHKAVKKITDNHAYVLTVMASMLVLARSDGVLASADFLWLKPVDRALWFMLNTIGRQTPFSEVGGPFAHWVAERTVGRKLMVPMVEEAVNALEGAIKEIVYIPDETN